MRANLFQKFQSTLPARGATGLSQNVKPDQLFQSTLPARGATGLSQNVKPDQLFQSTLPARGATLEILANNIVYIISIHAPRTGSDHGAVQPAQHCTLFQSTLPARGATKASEKSRRPRTIFQSTLPARGATVRDIVLSHVLRISIHAPRTGSDSIIDGVTGSIDISIHAPRTGSDNSANNTSSGSTISIHAPRTGSDACSSTIACVRAGFQSTLPARGATYMGIWEQFPFTFQSTLPARGATEAEQ